MISTLIIIAALLSFSDERRERWEEWVELGYHRRLLNEAEESLKGAEADPKSLALAARAAYASGLRDRAERWLKLSEEPPIKLEIARQHLEEDRLLAAMDLLFEERKLLVLRYKDSADGYMLSARALTRYGNREGARPILEEMVKRFPHDDEVPAALHLLSQDAIARGELEAARELRIKANTSARWRSFFDARRRQAIEHPNDPLPRFGVAALWMEAGEAQRARDVLDQLLLKAPKFARGHALRGDASRALGELDESLRSWSSALELDPNLHAARLNRSILWGARERWAEARADLELLVDLEEALSGPLIRAHLELSKALKALGDDEGASSARAKYELLTGRKNDK